MTLRDILNSKGSLVHSIDVQASLDEVVQTLVRHNCGSLIVRDARDTSGRMVGIITERDILRACAAHRDALVTRKVADAMTANLVVGSPADSVEDTMGLMTHKRIRHLPVVEGGELVGMVSIGDIVKLQHDQLSMENHYLKSYLHS
jgi:CBS domain-containing protein